MFWNITVLVFQLIVFVIVEVFFSEILRYTDYGTSKFTFYISCMILFTIVMLYNVINFIRKDDHLSEIYD